MGCPCQDDQNDFCPEEPAVAETTDESASDLTGPLDRRGFLKAAGIGAAALGTMSIGGALSNASVSAHTDNKSSCTAGDIEVTGGQIINEPCGCTPGGTFPAIAQFTVRNDNNAKRLNITLHLGAGGTLGGRDFVIRTGSDGVSGSCSIGGNGTTQQMY